jgi:hypothetical protein
MAKDKDRDIFQELKAALEGLALELPQTTRRLKGFERLQNWYSDNIERIEVEATRRGKLPGNFLVEMVDEALNAHLQMTDKQIRDEL